MLQEFTAALAFCAAGPCGFIAASGSNVGILLSQTDVYFKSMFKFTMQCCPRIYLEEGYLITLSVFPELGTRISVTGFPSATLPPPHNTETHLGAII